MTRATSTQSWTSKRAPGTTRTSMSHYRINPGNPLQIRWEGEDPGSKIRQSIEQRWDGRFPEDFQLRDLAARTERLLQVDRYFTAEVTPSIGQTPGGTREVTFDVFKGDRGRRVSVLFEGNQALTDRQLRRRPSLPVEQRVFRPHLR